MIEGSWQNPSWGLLGPPLTRLHRLPELGSMGSTLLSWAVGPQPLELCLPHPWQPEQLRLNSFK